jgi:hypothetical protein
VATRIRSHTQVLNDEVCFLVDPTVEGLAQGLLDSLQDEGQRRRVVAAARALYQAKYSRAAYERSLRSVLGLIERGCRTSRSGFAHSYLASTGAASRVTSSESAGAPSR